MTKLEKAAAWAGIIGAVLAVLTFVGLHPQAGSQSADRAPKLSTTTKRPSDTPAPVPSRTTAASSPSPSKWLGYDIENESESSPFGTLTGNEFVDVPNMTSASGRLSGHGFERVLITPGSFENEWPLGASYSTFSATFGVDDNANLGTSIEFVTRCDGSRVVSDVTVTQGSPHQVSTSIAGCYHLSIASISNSEFAAGVIADARVTAD